jgi:hypothetical protein
MTCVLVKCHEEHWRNWFGKEGRKFWDNLTRFGRTSEGSNRFGVWTLTRIELLNYRSPADRRAAHLAGPSRSDGRG